MRKRLLSIMLVLMLIFVLAACSPGAQSETSENSGDPYTAFLKVRDEMKDVHDVKFNMKTDVKSSDHSKYNTSLTAEVEQLIKDRNIRQQMDFDMKRGEEEINGKAYLEGEMMYMDISGQKIRVEPDSQMSELLSIDLGDLLEIKPEMITSMSMGEEGSDTVYEITVDQNTAKKYMEKNGKDAGVAESFDDVKCKTMDIKIVAGKDHIIKDLALHYDVEAKADGKKIEFDYDVVMEYSGINTGVEIDFPEFKDYKETGNF